MTSVDPETGAAPAGASPDRADAQPQAGPSSVLEQPPSGELVPIVANPYSGRGANQRRVAALAEALEAHGLTPQPIWTPADRWAALTDTTVLSRCRCIVSAGGDGSLTDLVNELAAVEMLDAVPLVTLPMGNENLFARQFGFSRAPKALARTIAEGRVRRIDAGMIQHQAQPDSHKWFTLMASAGLDADVVHRMDGWRRRGDKLRRVSRLSYVGRVLAALRQYPYPRVTLEADGRTVTGCHAFVFNIPQYGMNLGIARGAADDDGLLDWVVFEKPGRLALLKYGLAVYFARHWHLSTVHHGQARRITIKGDNPLQADGDPAGHLPVTITAQPGALRLLTSA
jgi:diacylglycerol kinase family enzyme